MQCKNQAIAWEVFKNNSRHLATVLRSQIVKTDIPDYEDAWICMEHGSLFGKKGSSLCKNPFGIEGHGKRNGSITITGRRYSDKKDQFTSLGILPGDVVCIGCNKELKQPEQDYVEENLDRDPSFLPDSGPSSSKSAIIHTFNTVIKNLPVSPLKMEKRNRPSQTGIVKKKLSQVQGYFTSEFKDAGLELKTVDDASSDLNTILNNIKDRCKLIDTKAQISLLRILPNHWGEDKVVKTCGVSAHVAREARMMYQHQGMEGEALKKKGNSLKDELKQNIVEFLSSENQCRVLPGLKDKVKIKNKDGVSEVHQKHLMLSTYKEAYADFTEEFLKRNPHHKVSMTTFIKYKPAYVLPLSKLNRHNVCVCVYHENVKLMCQAIGKFDYKDWITKLVCDTKNKTCMYLRCDICKNNDQELKAAINEQIKLKDLVNKSIKFRHWEKTDSSIIDTLMMESHAFSEKLLLLMKDLLKHHFLTKRQNEYFKYCKQNLKQDSAVVIADFSENYAPVFQDEIQSAHFSKGNGSTLHPFVTYLKNENEVVCISSAIISDCLEHSTNVFHAFIRKYIDEILLISAPHIKNITFFTDGCAAQYKSFKMTLNVAFFKKDFGMNTQFNYFASGHGKNACDGIGGTLKRMAREFSLRENLIATPRAFFEFCAERTKVEVAWMSLEEVITHIQVYQLEERYKLAGTIQGSKQLHKIVPWIGSDVGVDMFELSEDTEATVKKTFTSTTDEPEVVINGFSINIWYGCIYDNNWYVGQVMEFDEDIEEAFVKFLHQTTAGTFIQKKNDEAWVPAGRFLSRIPQPKQGNRGQLILEREVLEMLEKKFAEFKKIKT